MTHQLLSASQEVRIFVYSEPTMKCVLLAIRYWDYVNLNRPITITAILEKQQLLAAKITLVI